MRQVQLKTIELTMTRKTKTKIEVNRYLQEKMPVLFIDGEQQPYNITIDVVNIFTNTKWTKDKLKNYTCSVKIF